MCIILTGQERQILERIQSEFPLVSRPFKEIGSELGLSEETVFQAVQSLQAREVIKRISGMFDSHRLGYRTTLVALKVSPDAREEVALRLKELQSGITHLYARDSAYNLWFTLAVESDAEMEELLTQIRAYPGVEELVNLPRKQCFKLDVTFRIK